MYVTSICKLISKDQECLPDEFLPSSKYVDTVCIIETNEKFALYSFGGKGTTV